MAIIGEWAWGISCFDGQEVWDRRVCVPCTSPYEKICMGPGPDYSTSIAMRPDWWSTSHGPCMGENCGNGAVRTGVLSSSSLLIEWFGSNLRLRRPWRALRRPSIEWRHPKSGESAQSMAHGLGKCSCYAACIVLLLGSALAERIRVNTCQCRCVLGRERMLMVFCAPNQQKSGAGKPGLQTRFDSSKDYTITATR